MSTPNPLIPQGSLQGGGTSNVRIAVATVLAIHVVFFGGLLLQGCKRDTKTDEPTMAETNPPTTGLSYPPIDSNSLYYPSPSALPQDSTGTVAGLPSERTNFAPVPEVGIPMATEARNTATPARAPQSSALESGTIKEYTVVRGDSFSRIAQRQGSTVAAIRRANPGVEPTRIQPGMTLNVPIVGPGSSITSPSNGDLSGVYTVKPGDNLTKIARAHGVTISQLRAANDLRTSRVNVGQKLKIPTAASQAPANTNSTF
jgi:LysM repeat protein